MWLVSTSKVVFTHPPDQLFQLVHLEEMQVAESLRQIFSRALTTWGKLDELQPLSLCLVISTFALHLIFCFQNSILFSPSVAHWGLVWCHCHQSKTLEQNIFSFMIHCLEIFSPKTAMEALKLLEIDIKLYY